MVSRVVGISVYKPFFVNRFVGNQQRLLRRKQAAGGRGGAETRVSRGRLQVPDNQGGEGTFLNSDIYISI